MGNNQELWPSVRSGLARWPIEKASLDQPCFQDPSAIADAEAMAAALSDTDAPPMMPDELARMRRLPDIKALRARLGMTQEQFAQAYRLPLGTVRDWEQGRTRPDAPALVLLAVIEREPEVARRVLH
jgi:putative transcriptional regulator